MHQKYTCPRIHRRNFKSNNRSYQHLTILPQEDQRTEHDPQSCPIHEAIRDDVWLVVTPMTTKLYGFKAGAEDGYIYYPVYLDNVSKYCTTECLWKVELKRL